MRNRVVPSVVAAFLLAGRASAADPAVVARRLAAIEQRVNSEVKKDTALDYLRQYHGKRLALNALPADDLEDQSPLPQWFRTFLRNQDDKLPQKGPYQYPRFASEALEWMIANQNFIAKPVGARSHSRAASTAASNCQNVDLSQPSEINSEASIAIDANEPKYLVAASNYIRGSGHQKQFASSDGGQSWQSVELDFSGGSTFACDPSVAFARDGSAWVATLGVDASTQAARVQVFKSGDHGSTWAFAATVSESKTNDKEQLAIDVSPSSPYRDFMYVVWDVPGNGVWLSRSTNGGMNWSPPALIGAGGEAAVGAAIAIGPGGEVYVAWPNTGTGQIVVSRSTNGGASFDLSTVVVTTTGRYDVGIPAFCLRRALIYPVLAVDRSSGSGRGHVYVAWTDLTSGSVEPGCDDLSSSSRTRILTSLSTDRGAHFSAPKAAFANGAQVTDQFNPWLDCDAHSGDLALGYYETGAGQDRRAASLYLVRSHDGAAWDPPQRVSPSLTNETTSGADTGNQYGDYTGLAVLDGVAHPVWTDRSTSTAAEQVYSAACSPK